MYVTPEIKHAPTSAAQVQCPLATVAAQRMQIVHVTASARTACPQHHLQTEAPPTKPRPQPGRTEKGGGVAWSRHGACSHNGWWCGVVEWCGGRGGGGMACSHPGQQTRIAAMQAGTSKQAISVEGHAISLACISARSSAFPCMCKHVQLLYLSFYARPGGGGCRCRRHTAPAPLTGHCRGGVYAGSASACVLLAFDQRYWLHVSYIEQAGRHRRPA